ncbi:apolipoprotein N-acyltransferase [Sphingomonas ursincola]|uniref:apolipoprotein N-acyltransferase n=1 Tax=Sphingomonas ursincola TaxID=56361 RepID=UPI0023534FE5|nr:apolipoprotein N-acyltransferase [Sphingomonas ursincola]MBY0620274.1 apolipoprotein N-acyltransferase [Sphingomonas ursincola]
MIQRFPKWLALLAGGLSATGFAPLNLWPVTLACMALLIHLIATAPSRKAAFSRGWLFGLGQFTIGLNWIAIAFTYQDAMPHWLGWVAVVGLSCYLALFPALATLLAHLLPRKTAAADICFILAFAALWLVTEWMRAWVFTGFAWNPLGVIALEFGWAARLVGTYGLGALVMLIAGALLQGVQRQWKPALGLFAGVALLSLGGWTLAPSPAGFTRTPITVVQPNNDQSDKYDPVMAARNFARLVDQTVDRKARPGRIVFWPEAATEDFVEDGYPRRYYYPETPAGIRARLTRPINDGDLLVTGGVKLDFDRNGRAIAAANSVFVFSSQAEILGSYDKSHLVPGGEYLPYEEILGQIGLSRLVPGTLGFTPGPGAQTLDLGRLGRMGLQICYEIVFSGEVADRNNRPDFIFNPSNDAWFGPWGPPQHLAQARMRGLEEGLPVIRSTPTGISAVVDADGRLLDSIAHHKAGHIDTVLPRAHAATPFALWGNALALGLAGLLLLFAVALRAFPR